MAHVHSRMPVILPDAAVEPWLDARQPFASAARVLVPYEGSDLCVMEQPATPPPQGDLFQ